jgi:SEL1 protein
MFNMGYMYLRGLGAQQNFQQAQHWFEQAAEAGLPAAYNGLGVMNFNGQGTSQNFTSARIAFEKGAHGGDADSMFNLVSYNNGV